jgi:dynein regulatory complex protein 1
VGVGGGRLLGMAYHLGSLFVVEKATALVSLPWERPQRSWSGMNLDGEPSQGMDRDARIETRRQRIKERLGAQKGEGEGACSTACDAAGHFPLFISHGACVVSNTTRAPLCWHRPIPLSRSPFRTVLTRIFTALSTLLLSPATVSKAKVTQEEESRSKAQISDSRARIDKLKTTGSNEVTKVRIIGDSRENERRINEEVNRQGRRQKLLYEAESSARQNAAVAMKWSALFDKEIPQELLAEIEIQRDSCERIIQSKDRLIKEFKTELKSKDDEYVKSLKKQNDDVELLLERMTRQFTALRKTFDDELEEIETSFMQERAEVMHANQTELSALMQKRLDKEEQYMEARRRRVDEDQRQLEGQRVHDQEDLNILKIKLETEIQTLEQQLEEMRATYQLNQEKLDYNYRVLVERDSENTNTIKQQKKKLTRMADILSTLKARYAREERKFKTENQVLTEEYKGITAQFKDLQAKFQHFEVADTKRYRDVWQMNEEAVTDLMRKVLQADKIIHEQQLGLSWLPPSEHIFHAGGDGAGAGPSGAGGGEGEGEGGPISRGQMDNENIKHMLELLCNEAGFLVEGKIQKLLEPLPPDEQNLLKIDSILKVLGVEGAADVEKLLSYFLADADNHELIHPNDAIKAIKAFVEEHQAERQRGGESVKASKPSAKDGGQEGTRREEREFWERMSSIISDKTFRVWSALEKALHKYDALLKSRGGLITEVGDLQRQNGELKALLNQYLSSRINEDLHVPPTQVIRLDGLKRGGATR